MFFSGIGNMILNLNILIKEKKKIHRIKFIMASILAIISFYLILYIKNAPFIINVIFGIFMILLVIVIGLSL
jgi:hypothetical protein